MAICATFAPPDTLGGADRCPLHGKPHLRGHVQGRGENRGTATYPAGQQDRRGYGQADGTGSCEPRGRGSMTD